MDSTAVLSAAGFEETELSSGDLQVTSPIDGQVIARLATHDHAAADAAVGRAAAAFEAWRKVPAPRRGELIRLLGEGLRAEKQSLGRLVTLECGKSFQEGLGEVQEMIDICDFAVGLSRQLYGLTIASERPGHAMSERWHPLGVCGVITAFNFPVAPWAWNATLAIVCGDPVVWKPSEKTPLTALACAKIFARAVERFGEEAPAGLLEVLVGGREAGEVLTDDPRVAVVSATGSVRMGQQVGPRVAARFGRSILELGGNNAMIVTPSADLDLAVRAILFAAVGTAGQRCTTLRRLIVHEDVKAELVERLKKAYAQVRIGDPMVETNLVGPLIDRDAFDNMQKALQAAQAQGGTVHGGERVLAEDSPWAYYVQPALVEMPGQTDIVREETFAPILYVMSYRAWDEAIALQNGVPQGLSSCVFTKDLGEAEAFVSAIGSDCGIANVNIGPSGAEIGGAFGGEKHTGGGRESGSDAWKGYMRRQTVTVNYSGALPLAQGIKFEL